MKDCGKLKVAISLRFLRDFVKGNRSTRKHSVKRIGESRQDLQDLVEYLDLLEARAWNFGKNATARNRSRRCWESNRLGSLEGADRQGHAQYEKARKATKKKKAA